MLLWIGAGVLTAIGACSKDALGPSAGPVESVLVAPSTATVAVGSNLTLSAEVRDVGGNVLESAHVSWASADASIAEVSSIGVVTGRKVGTVLIAASSRGRDAFSRVTVNPTPVATVRLSLTSRAMLVGETVSLVAEALDNGGRILTGRPVSWLSSDAAVATVTATGVVTALGPGAAIITASVEGRSAVATITVSLVPVASVEVTPPTSNIVVGQTSRLSARLRDASGATITGRALVWTSNSSNVASVSSDGLVTASAPGTATITASSEGRSGSATVNVTARPASAVIVSPGQVTIFAAQTVQLSALVTDDRGQVLTGQTVSFLTSNAQVATVSAAGVVTGIATGSATITATSDGATGTAVVTIAPDPVAAVDVTPASPSIIVGSTVQMVATPKNASGQPLTGRTVSWSSGSPSLASISSSGVVTGLAPGNVAIIATVDGKQGSAMVLVRAVPVASVTVTPATATTNVGQTVALTATPRDASGNPLSGRIVGWSSSDNAIATVSSTGVVTALAGGSVTITASSEGQAGTATVTVGLVPVATVSVTPAQSTMTVGQTVTLVANPLNAAGQPLTGRTVSWSSASPGVASVSGAGVVTGVSAGNAVITATVGGVAGSATVVVNQAPAGSVTVTPSTSTLTVGQTATLGATVRDAAGNVIAGASVTWASSATSVATVSASGVVTGVAPGTATITASSGGRSGTAAVTVNPAPAATVTVSPSTLSIQRYATSTLTAIVRDANGNVIAGAPITWTSTNTAVATVSSSGTVSAVAVGSATVRATSGSASGTSAVTVTNPPVDRIVVTPANPRVDEGKTIQMTATVYDANNNVIPGVTVTWTSGNTNRATVNSTGLVTGVNDGNVTITASAGGKSGSTTVRVVEP